MSGDVRVLPLAHQDSGVQLCSMHGTALGVVLLTCTLSVAIPLRLLVVPTGTSSTSDGRIHGMGLGTDTWCVWRLETYHDH